MSEVREVDTRHGIGRLHIDRGRRAMATLVLGHGAGGGPDAVELVALAQELPRQGITCVRAEQPWRVAGRRIASAPRTLDEALEDMVGSLRIRGPLVLGGRSAGARSACRVARKVGAVGVVALAYPLHPPGKPESSRIAELEGAGVPTLVVQGERDTFGRPEEFPAGVELTVVPGADHAMRVLKRGEVDQDMALAVVVEAVLEFIVHDVTGAPVTRGNQG
jgi:hypothetical protein